MIKEKVIRGFPKGKALTGCPFCRSVNEFKYTRRSPKRLKAHNTCSHYRKNIYKNGLPLAIFEDHREQGSGHIEGEGDKTTEETLHKKGVTNGR